MKILIAEDDQYIREGLRDLLEAEGYQTVLAVDGAEAVAKYHEVSPHFVLLDIMMPQKDGYTVCREIRNHDSQVPVIFLSAKSEEIDRVIGLELGADDYVGKPVDLRELAARIKSVLRRSGRETVARPETGDVRKVAFGSFVLDLDGHELTDRNGAVVELTTMEFDLLSAFVERPNRVLTRDQLLDMAHHRRWDPYDRSIDIRIARLRRKIERDPQKPEIIKTVRGAGYIFIPNGKGPEI